MRYIDINAFLATVPANKKKILARAYRNLKGQSEATIRQRVSSGNTKWRPIKSDMEAFSSRKCWYTESKNAGFPNEVEHFRPKGKITDSNNNLLHWYWFLAFNPANYRLSCQFSNRLNVNPATGKTGGKGDEFPLLASSLNGNSLHATSINEVKDELPVLLDPCVEEDTKLLAFSPEGKPVVAPHAANCPIAKKRVEESNLLLNLDFPTFNEEREELYAEVVRLIKRGDRHEANQSDALEDVKEDLEALMQPEKPYSKAAESYIRGFRDRDWVDEVIQNL
ncbi:hypothetical protein NTE05_002764 [Vibrio harveyi]|nr:hypothetical protein [Vibrio harveyi]